MLTADTITDDQIRKLREDVGCWVERALANIALRPRSSEYARIARERCAEILNVRAKETA